MEIKSFTALRYNKAEAENEVTDLLTVEAALQIKINSRAYTITMRTPGNDLYLTVGLLFTEGIISSFSDIKSLKEVPDSLQENNLIVDVSVDDKIIHNKNIFNRSIASSASCGVCGKIELCDLVTPIEVIKNNHHLKIEVIPELLNRMLQYQKNFKVTGGAHAASVFDKKGNLLSIQEDIGRHNAVDKTIGNILMNDTLAQAAVLCISGRVSYEIVSKCAKAGIPILIAVSAPSSLAVEFCTKAGITLIAFCRSNKATVYTHGYRIKERAAKNDFH